MIRIYIYLLKRNLIELSINRVVAAFSLLAISKLVYPFSKPLGFSLLSKAARLYPNRFITRSSLHTFKKYQYVPSFVNPETNGRFGERVFILKEKASENEKGILLLMFNSTIRDFPLYLDVNKVMEDYYLILEPSWSGFFIDEILQYTKFSSPVWVLSGYFKDFEFLKQLGSNLIPLPIGPCDWVDPELTGRVLSSVKKYDIVFNSNWASWKRHQVLFSAIKKITRPVRVALIGVELEGRNRKDIELLAKFYNVQHLIEIFERVPYIQALEITASSKCALLLSLKEGSNRALAEAMMCDVPVILLENHIGGIRKNINPMTGILTSETKLNNAILHMIEDFDHYSPRKWAIENASCFVSSQLVNTVFKQYSLDNHLEWSKDIWVRTNSPESCYTEASLNSNRPKFDYERFKLLG